MTMIMYVILWIFSSTRMYNCMVIESLLCEKGKKMSYNDECVPCLDEQLCARQNRHVEYQCEHRRDILYPTQCGACREGFYIPPDILLKSASYNCLPCDSDAPENTCLTWKLTTAAPPGTHLIPVAPPRHEGKLKKAPSDRPSHLIPNAIGKTKPLNPDGNYHLNNMISVAAVVLIVIFLALFLAYIKCHKKELLRRPGFEFAFLTSVLRPDLYRELEQEQPVVFKCLHPAQVVV